MHRPPSPAEVTRQTRYVLIEATLLTAGTFSRWNHPRYSSTVTPGFSLKVTKHLTNPVSRSVVGDRRAANVDHAAHRVTERTELVLSDEERVPEPVAFINDSISFDSGRPIRWRTEAIEKRYWSPRSRRLRSEDPLLAATIERFPQEYWFDGTPLAEL